VAPLRILIVGGYGTFGGRLVELIEDDPRLTLIVAGRSLAQAQAYCATRSNAAAKLIPSIFDRNRITAKELGAIHPDLVVDASGPFQAYGDKPYKLIELCIECRVNYLDLADGSDFVAGVAQFDAPAKEAGIFVLAGVSSFPVLTAAVVRRLSTRMSSIQSIRGGIAPSPFAGVGANVIRAIASYSGQPVALRKNGRSSIGYPLVEAMPFVIAPPGRMPLERRRFSLVDVPDLRALPALWPTAQEVWMGAAPVPLVLHLALNAFAWLVKIRLLPSLSWMSKAMHLVTERAQWGEHRGGMFVAVTGVDPDGQAVSNVWHLLAEGDDGPLIPCMAIEAIIRGMLSGREPERGARTAIADVSLEDYERLFKRRKIYTGIRDQAPAALAPLFQRILGSAWQELAHPIQDLHTIGTGRSFEGHCTVKRGRNVLAQLVANINHFPGEGNDQPISMRIDPQGEGERWSRTCGGRTFSSTQRPGLGRSEWLVREQFGPVAVDVALLLEDSNLRYVLRRWTFLGIPMPLAWGPRLTALESVQHGVFKFDVNIDHPLIGLIVHYTGTLVSA
jgi:hypothetical protein